MKHLLFYDSECPLCNRSIRFVLAADKKELFAFAPLQGETAKRELADFHLKRPHLDTLVLIQDFCSPKPKRLIEGRGAFRIMWLLGGKYRFLGWLSYLPSFLFDLCYRIVARYRYKLFTTNIHVTLPPHRSLP